MFRAGFWQQLLLVASGLLTVGASPSPTKTTAAKRNNNGSPSRFVTTENGQFVVNGSAFRLLGTNAYWLPTVPNDEDIDFVFGNMSAVGINAVRTWAFNDVDTIPEEGTWFQLIQNGTTIINTGANGLQKLDKLVQAAERHGIYLILSLTNNWNPRNSTEIPADSVARYNQARRNNNSGNTVPRNTLSNDYGGMDAYIRGLLDVHEHDQFYTNNKILKAFKNYTSEVISRYVDSPAVLGWELANDPRCSSSLPASTDCDAQVVTRWHADIADHVQSIDPNHLVASGNQGFFCVDCPKLFPIVTPPPPQTSPVPGQRRRSVPAPLTKRKLLQERKEYGKKLQKRSAQPADGIRVRGRWIASHATRQESGLSSAFNGVHGVDSEDIGNIPTLAFHTFQLFPDQNDYGHIRDPNLSNFENNVQSGLEWIQRQAATGALLNKPVAMTGFGLVTQENAPFFTPFNSTTAQFGSSPSTQGVANLPTNPQRNDAYNAWLSGSISSGLGAMFQYQYGQTGLTPQSGTSITPTTTGQSPNQVGTGQSPNDGYSFQPYADSSSQGVFQGPAQIIGTKN